MVNNHSKLNMHTATFILCFIGSALAPVLALAVAIESTVNSWQHITACIVFGAHGAIAIIGYKTLRKSGDSIATALSIGVFGTWAFIHLGIKETFKKLFSTKA